MFNNSTHYTDMIYLCVYIYIFKAAKKIENEIDRGSVSINQIIQPAVVR